MCIINAENDHEVRNSVTSLNPQTMNKHFFVSKINFWENLKDDF